MRSIPFILFRPFLVSAAALVVACYSTGSDPADVGPGDEVIDTEPEDGMEVALPRPVDLLVVEFSRYGEAQELVSQTEFVGNRLAPSLLEQDIDLRVGVLTSDLGGAGELIHGVSPISGCGYPCDRLDGTSSSDEGRLLTLPDCWPDQPDLCGMSPQSDPGHLPYPPPAGGYPPYLDAADPLFGQWIAALMQRADGCPLLQPLESLYRALDGTTNPGFLRENSVLAVLIVSRRDDCSVADPAAIAPFDGEFPGGLPERCGWRSELLHPIERYVDRLLSVRPADRLVVGVFAGMDVEPRWCTGSEPECESLSGMSCSEEHPCLLWESCPDSGDHLVAPASRLHGFSRRLGVTSTGRPVAVQGSSCRFYMRSTEEEVAAFRAEILDRAGR